MKYSLTFLMIGGLVSYLGITLGAWWHLLHWFSFSCIALSAGYARLGPRIFGKQPDGRIPVWSKIIHFPYMLYSEMVWQITRVLSRETATDKVLDDLIIGRRLRTREMPFGVTNWVDLTSEVEDPREIRESTNYINLPILDASIPTQEALRSTIDLLTHGVTYVHCAQGYGRTGLFALTLLADRGRIRSFDDGMALIKSARPGIKLNRIQEKFVRKFIAEQNLCYNGANVC